MTRFVDVTPIGQGTYGKVYRAYDSVDKCTVAIKKVECMEDPASGVSRMMVREISLLKSLVHPNIVALKNVLYQAPDSYMVFEYMATDLHRAMRDGRVGSDLVKPIMFQVLSAIDYLHTRRVIHRDLKPENILLDMDRQLVKVADLGMAREFRLPVRSQSPEIVTLWYRAPEIILGATCLSTALDIWSMGCIFAEMATAGSVLFRGTNEIDQLFQVFKILGTPTDSVWPGVDAFKHWNPEFPKWTAVDLASVVPQLGPDGIDLLKSMVQYRPAARISARNALKHPYFRSIVSN